MEILGMAESRALAGDHSGKVQPGTEEIDYIPARPLRPLEQPEYPPSLLISGPKDFSIAVVITIDEEGRVTDVEKSWRDSLQIASAQANEFLEAVRAAVLRWSIQGARQVYYRRNANGEREYLRTEKSSERVEIRFTFEKSAGRKR